MTRSAATGAALFLVTLVLGAQIHRFAPVGDGGVVVRQAELQRPFVRSGTLRETVAGTYFTARVNGVRGAGRVGSAGFSRVPHRTTPGIWLILDVTLTSRDEARVIGFGGLRDEDGRLYHASRRCVQPLVGGREFQPDIPVRGEVVFEIPQKVAAQELTAVFARTTFSSPMDSQVEITLPAPSGAATAAWKRATSAVPEEIR
ncbi:MAG: hypothetical protein QG622_1670 [Actinomycetota bacterium]|nr:hypothetical protein [Actinomycetota bacterium]